MKKFLFILLFLFISVNAIADPPNGFNEKDSVFAKNHGDKVVQIERTISHLMRKAPARKISADAEYRRAVATDIVYVAVKYGVPVHLFNVVIFQESSFRMDAMGLKEEKGLGQVMNPERYGCDMSTRIGQLECSARYLVMGYEKCGSWEGSLSHYQSSTGSCTPKKGSRHETMVHFRMLRWIKLRSRYSFAIDKSF
jgi:hypothetical protein